MTTEVRYQFSPVPFTAVQVEDDFWSPRMATNRRVTIPYDFQKCEETGRVDNFVKAAGVMEGDHVGIFFDDSDVYKVIEAAAYSLSLHPDADLDRYLDDLIAKIAAAQEKDGYLYTARTIAERTGQIEKLQADREGLTRWSNLRVNHELYNVGHLYEAAVAHFQATGKRSLLDVALKNADLIDSVFGPDKKRDVPGHQEIEIGLVKLHRLTGDERYLKLGRFFLDERGHAHDRELYTLHDNPGYMQDHLPVVEQVEAVGHAVRAGYMYCGMADVAALTGDAAYVAAIDRIWENVVSKKLYLTGGIGARHRGEAFGENYELPNATAYNETCAAIANTMWNHRMFLLHGEAKYMDVLERVIYNGFLSGIGFSGDLFFYPNPLACDGQTAFNKNGLGRAPWFRVACCPPNVARFIASLSGYIYAHRSDELYVNLYMGGQAMVEMERGNVRITQETRYPWDGQIRLTIEPAEPIEMGLHLRIPGWAKNEPIPGDLYRYLDVTSEPVRLQVNSEAVALDLEKGFARIRRTWQPGDVVELDLPLPIRRVVSHERLEENAGRVALERGPIVYCVEGVDHGGQVSHLALPDDAPLTAKYRPDLLNGVTVITGPALDVSDGKWAPQSLTAIPYYAWAHRDVGEMAVWLRRA